MADISELKGKTLSKIIQTEDRIEFYTKKGEAYVMYHCRDCCETVTIEDIDGDLQDLIGSKILNAYVETNSGTNEGDDSFTWTFYRISNRKVTITIRWYGTSNGYYSESVDFEKM
jgi:hypothetical protein